MRLPKISKSVLFGLLLGMMFVTVDVAAQPAAARRGRIYGDWAIKIDFNGTQFDSLLSFSRSREGNQTAHWISIMGVSELKDVKYEKGQLSFVQERQNREGETITSKFKGTVKGGKLSGTISSDRGEFQVEGARRPRMPRAVGSWEIKFKIGEREMTSQLVIKAEKGGKIAVQWPSERVEHKISDTKYERGKLTFKSHSKMQEREWDSSFEGRIRGNTLSGAFKSERGEMKVEGKRIGAAIIGTWNLEVTSDQRSSKQRLLVNPDMSGLYGANAIEKITFEDDKVTFKMILKFGGQEYEIGFQGALKESKLNGELTTEMGPFKIAGTKVVRPPRRRKPDAK